MLFGHPPLPHSIMEVLSLDRPGCLPRDNLAFQFAHEIYA